MTETEGSAGAGGGVPVEQSRSGEPPPPPREVKEKKGEGSELDPDAWMVTFSDLLTLLMTFFVLIFASADPIPEETLFEAFGQTTGVFGLYRTGFLEKITAVQGKDINQDLVQVFLDQIGASDVEVKQQEEGLVITLPSDTYFEPGRARLNKKALARIEQLAAFLNVTRHRIRVEGHTDNRERVRQPYPGRWELSLARAHRVLEQLVAKEVPERRLSLSGNGPSRPRFSNVSRRGRTLNRRVDIVILNRPGAGQGR